MQDGHGVDSLIKAPRQPTKQKDRVLEIEHEEISDDQMKGIPVPDIMRTHVQRGWINTFGDP